MTTFDLDQYAEVYPEGIARTWWQLTRKSVIGRTFERFIPPSARVLEVGCGTGIVTHHLRTHGWEVEGVELGTPQRGLHVAEHLMLGQDATTLPLDFRAGIDTLALFDVIEHIEDAPAFLRHLLAAFPNSRTVVITVPAGQKLWSNFDDYGGHFRRYDLRLLDAELRDAGLVAVHCRYFFYSLALAIRLNNLLRGSKRQIKQRVPTPGPVAFLNQALGAIFSWEARLLPDTLPGSSIIAVAQRGPLPLR